MQTFTHYNEPYGTVEFTVKTDEPVTAPKLVSVGNEYLANRAAAGWRRLSGHVVRGSETSRIFQHTNTRDLAGEPYALDVPPESYATGKHRTIACG